MGYTAYRQVLCIESVKLIHLLRGFRQPLCTKLDGGQYKKKHFEVF